MGRKAKGNTTKSKNEKPTHSKFSVYIVEMTATTPLFYSGSQDPRKAND